LVPENFVSICSLQNRRGKFQDFFRRCRELFAFLLDLERGSDGGHDLFEARVAAQIIPLWTKLHAFTGKRNAG